MAKIKLLSSEIINQIAAGEIIERPASVIKELVENSIDASSSKIDVFIQNAGKRKIIVEDNGTGIEKDDLIIAVQRHTTSKFSSFADIQSYGFRGEALSSIVAISRFILESQGFGVSVEFSKINELVTSSVTNGTKISVLDIFDQLPARLKFLKADNFEKTHCISVIENFALIHPEIEFTLRDNKHILLNFKNDSIEERISTIVGKELFGRSVYFDDSNDIMRIYGYLFHPMDSKCSQGSQKIFVNNRIVKDKIIALSIRNAYRELIPAGRFTACIIFIEINPFYLDVNVSPTKSEIRFRDTKFVSDFVTSTIKKQLSKFDRISININKIFNKCINNCSNLSSTFKFSDLSLGDSPLNSLSLSDSLNDLSLNELSLNNSSLNNLLLSDPLLGNDLPQNNSLQSNSLQDNLSLSDLSRCDLPTSDLLQNDSSQSDLS